MDTKSGSVDVIIDRKVLTVHFPLVLRRVLVVTAQDATLIRANLIQPDHVPEGTCRMEVGSAVVVVTALLHTFLALQLPCAAKVPTCKTSILKRYTTIK